MQLHRVLMTSTKSFEKDVFNNVLRRFNSKLDFTFTDTNLKTETANMAKGFDAVCVFVTDKLDRPCLIKLKEAGVKFLALRSAGFNHVDIPAAKELGITVARVPKYSPQAIAEFAVGLYLCLNRKIHRAHNRVREGNFSLEGLMGADVHKQTIGIVGTGNIGKHTAQIFSGFGAQVLAFDLTPDQTWAEKYGIKYVELSELIKTSDVVSLHVPLNERTKNMINEDVFSAMKPNSYLINTSRGGLVNTRAMIKALKAKKLAGAALDVYEEEENVFFKDHSDEIIDDDVLTRLMTFPNALITSHQAFLTRDALEQIATTTINNLTDPNAGNLL